MRPINATAARVVSNGVHFNTKYETLTFESDTPIPTKRLMPNVEDLTGIRFCRLTVIGLARDYKKRWVCRCDCGVYTLRRRKAVLNPTNTLDRCHTCTSLIESKKRYHYDKTGINLPEENFDT